MEPRKPIPGRRRCFERGRQHVSDAPSQGPNGPAWSKNLACAEAPWTGTGRSQVWPAGGALLWPASGRRGAVADDERTWEVRLRNSSWEADEQSRATGCRDLACSAGWRAGKNDPGGDRTYIRRGTARPAARVSHPEQSDAGGRHHGRPEGAHSAQDATASGRVISTIWRVVFFDREDLPCGAIDPAPPSSVPPKILESVGRHFGVSNGVLDVLVPEVVLQGARVVTIVGQLEPAGMAQHVGVDREWHLGDLAEALDEPMEPNGTDWPAALGNEYVGVSRVIAA